MSRPDEPRQKALSEAVELLRWELSTLSDRRWEDIPELKRKKVVLASRLRQIDPTPGPMVEPADRLLLKSQISDLEQESREKIDRHLELIGNQILALQEQHQYWRECLNISFRKFLEPAPSR